MLTCLLCTEFNDGSSLAVSSASVISSVLQKKIYSDYTKQHSHRQQRTYKPCTVLCTFFDTISFFKNTIYTKHRLV